MPREVFPYDEDRKVIQGFLAGETRSLGASLDDTHARGGRLHVSGEVFMWYDTQGALWAQIGARHIMHGQVRAFNYAAELVGVPYVVIERVAKGGTDDVIQTQLWFDGQEIGFSSPFVVLGNMSVRAWRESVLAKIPLTSTNTTVV